MTDSLLAISFKEVSFAYQVRKGFLKTEPLWVLKEVSFDLYHGETLGVIGRNGVGKSTLLSLLAGITEPNCGKVIHHQKIKASLLSLQLGFIPHLNGKENIMLSAMLLGLKKHEVIDNMDAIIAYSGLGSFIHRPICEYSSGMQARLGFSIATHANPDVLLIDEVLGVGDEDFRLKSTKTMEEKIRSNKTIVIVSHDSVSIKRLCDRVIWIEQGNIVEEGEPEYVVDAYLSASVSACHT